MSVPTAGDIDFDALAEASEKFSLVQIGDDIYRAAATAALHPESERRVDMASIVAAIHEGRVVSSVSRSFYFTLAGTKVYFGPPVP